MCSEQAGARPGRRRRRPPIARCPAPRAAQRRAQAAHLLRPVLDGLAPHQGILELLDQRLVQAVAKVLRAVVRPFRGDEERELSRQWSSEAGARAAGARSSARQACRTARAAGVPEAPRARRPLRRRTSTVQRCADSTTGSCQSGSLPAVEGGMRGGHPGGQMREGEIAAWPGCVPALPPAPRGRSHARHASGHAAVGSWQAHPWAWCRCV